MFRFGAFDVDFSNLEMTKRGVRVRIQEQPLRILQALLEQPGEVVTREQLRDRLWPSDTFVDFERSLNAAVAKLRQALNDSAEQPRYIETVARKGYRFVAPVSSDVTAADPISTTKLATVPVRPRAILPWVCCGVLGAGLLACGWALWRSQQARTEHPLLQLDLAIEGDVSQPAVSPDGARVVFVTAGRLAARRLDRPTIVPLHGTEGASFPFFSPDSRSVGFFANRKLQKVSLEGGSPVTLCDAPLGVGGSWGNDGHMIVALNTTGGLFRVPESGGSPQPFTDLSAETEEVTNHRSPQILPDGRGVLFVAGTGPASGSLRVQPKSGPARTLVEDTSGGRYLTSGFLVYYQRGTLFGAPFDLKRLALSGPATPLVEGVAHENLQGAEFDVSANGVVVYRSASRAKRVIQWVDASGGVEPIMKEPGEYSTPRLSPDGKRLAVTVFGDGNNHIAIIDLLRSSTRRLTFDSEIKCCPVWTPDGEYVVFTQGSSIAWMRADGSGTVARLPANNKTAVPWSFTPDGRWLTFHRNEPRTGYDLWAAAVERPAGGFRLSLPKPILQWPGIQAAPAVSPDGRWLAFGSDESGMIQLYAVAFEVEGVKAGGKWQLSKNGGMSPLWSRGGQKLFFRSLDRRIHVVSYAARKDALVADAPRLWSDRQLADVGPAPSFDVAPDGKRIVGIFDYEGSGANDSHLRLLLNAGDELRSRSSIRQ